MSHPPDQCFTPERLAYWYLRLNGFALVENFIVHPDVGSNQRTDADLLGVRFRNRAELLLNPMPDDPVVAGCTKLCNVVIAEVKRDFCELNGPWADPHNGNLKRVLKAIGCFSDTDLPEAVESIYQRGQFQTAQVQCRLLAFGDLPADLPIQGVLQLLWSDVIDFLGRRFDAYRTQKTSVGQWAHDGRAMQKLVKRRYNPARFETDMRRLFGLRGSPGS